MIRRLVLLVVASGACALIYQVAWTRLLRLVFGTSTAATAAVLAIFMGGLGLGALMLGRRADTAGNPLRFYGHLELGVAIAAALSPALIALVRSFYIATGGTESLGVAGATAVRLLLSSLVLGVPTFLMGGTLPAVARAVESAADVRRRHLGVLYGANTLGAVAGAILTTFVSLEHLGTRVTIWSASALNLGVALVALLLSRGLPDGEPPPPPRSTRRRAVQGRSKTRGHDTSSPPSTEPTWLVLVAAAMAGFAFLVMELVWYRMLAPLLGGSSYTFGLILAVALLGIGVGGLAYGAFGRQRSLGLGAFAVTCALEAACIALPYAMGDRVALLALSVRQGVVAFDALVWGWLFVTLVVVFPGAVVSGYQFPLLVGLLGHGRERVGQDVGRVYAANTLGAITGSLAGGFGLMPLLSAPGVWRAVVYGLAALGVVAAVQAARGGARLTALATLTAAFVAIGCSLAQGPTAFWRHSSIGARDMQKLALSDANDVQRALNKRRLEVLWDTDGIESGVALNRQNGLAFYVNGASDGNAVDDAATQVMLGLIGSMMHPDPKRALVIGLGTGQTAGWLAKVSSIERVDVFELEPAVMRVAEACALTNQDVLRDPKVRVVFGDARELLLTASASYDVIASEPSNPYRAGVASLFTKEFYAAASARLGPDGVFVQWVQAYDVRPEALRTIYSTLGAVFRSVETWETSLGDLAFLARKGPPVHDVARVRARAEQEPYRSALALLWGVSGAEGVYTGFRGNTDFAADFRGAGPVPVNTDDLTVLEFELARSVGKGSSGNIPAQIRDLAAARGHDRPSVVNGSIDWREVAERRAARIIAEGDTSPGSVPTGDPAVDARQQARQAYAAGNFSEVRKWLSQSAEPATLGDLRMVAETFTYGGHPRAPEYIRALGVWQPVEAMALQAIWYQRTGNAAAAVDRLLAAFQAYRQHPWTNRVLFMRAFNETREVLQEPGTVSRGFEGLTDPFAARALDITRLEARASIGMHRAVDRLCVAALAPLEPNVPWGEPFLQGRLQCYASVGHPLTGRARADLDTFLANARKTR